MLDELQIIKPWALGSLKAPSPFSNVLGMSVVFLTSFLVRSLYTVDLKPVMYTRAQPSIRMAARYDEGAVAMLAGHGILFPDNADPSDTRLLARPPGYALFLRGVYSSLGRSFFTVQLAQNLLTSAASLLVVFLGTRLVGGRVGFVAGLLAGLSPHLSFLSNLILPDALCPLALLLGTCCLVEARPEAGFLPFLALSGLGGVALGGSAWLRPNMMLVGGILAGAMVVLHHLRGRWLLGAMVVPVAAALVIAPITIRNYLIYHEFVPLSINGGITLWEGIADAGGQKYGARSRDKLVMEEEAVRYHNRRYAEWWAFPDGIERDRDRYKRSFEVIKSHPLWYGRAMLRRMIQILDSASEPPPLVGGGAPPIRSESLDESEPGDPSPLDNFEERGLGAQRGRVSDVACLSFGRAAGFARPLVRLAQRVTRSAMLPLTLVGTFVVLLLDARRAVFLWAVPLYCLLTESMMLLEWRVVVSLHVFLLVFASVGWIALAAALGKGVGLLRARLSDRLKN